MSDPRLGIFDPELARGRFFPDYDRDRHRHDHLEAEGWVAPNLQNDWVNYGSGWQTVRYRMEANGVVRVQGLVKNGTGVTVFTLPEAYRPSADHIFTCETSSGPQRVNVRDGGEV